MNCLNLGANQLAALSEQVPMMVYGVSVPDTRIEFYETEEAYTARFGTP